MSKDNNAVLKSGEALIVSVNAEQENPCNVSRLNQWTKSENNERRIFLTDEGLSIRRKF
jgi:hypothetical protein